MIFLRYFLLLSLVGAKEKNVTYDKYRTGLIPLNIGTIWRQNDEELAWVKYDDNVKIPENFDPRTEWPRCESIGKIYDQGKCEWCWAVTTASVLTDRWCIFANGTDNFEYSAVDLLSCCHDCHGKGKPRPGVVVKHCSPGIPYCALKHIKKTGAVSASCKPITSEITVRGNAPLCEDKCADHRDPANITKKYLKTYRLLENSSKPGSNDYLKQLQIELMTNGPVPMNIYASSLHFIDFFNNKENADKIYQGDNEHQGTKKERPDHAIRLLGWGQENGTPYWLCANSWGMLWGNEGFFKILRGTNLLISEEHFLIPYHNEPPQKTRQTADTEVSSSCAKTVTIENSILLCIVMMYLPINS